MNESEIRSRMRRAIGDAEYPPALIGTIRTRLKRPANEPRQWVLTLVTVLIAVALVATLMYVRGQSQSPRPATTPRPGPTTAQHVVSPRLPLGLLTSARSALTYPNQRATSAGRTVTIVAAYADPIYTAVILQAEAPLPQLVIAVQVFDDAGSLDNIDPGDYPEVNTDLSGWGAVERWGGAHAGRDGIVHLRLAMTGEDVGDIQASPVRLNRFRWDFAFDLKMQPATTHLPLKPTLTTIGTWTFRDVTFELTRGVIYFHAVITGAGSANLFFAVSLENPDHYPVGFPVGFYGPENSPDEGLNLYWARPPTKSFLKLTVSSRDATYVADVVIPAPPTS